MKLSILIVTAGLAALGLAAPTRLEPPVEGLSNGVRAFGHIVPDEYIVVLKKDVPDVEVQAHEVWALGTHNRRLVRRGDRRLRGLTRKWGFGKFRAYKGSFARETISEILKRPEVAYIEPVQTFSIFDQKLQARDKVVEENATWGLSRISNKVNPFQNTNGTSGPYAYDSSAGEGATVYVLDTGVRVNHVEFEGRARWGITTADNSIDDDLHGHGTHVAGTVAGKTIGVAKKAQVVAVKVLADNGIGTNTDVVEGIQWVAQDAKNKNIKKAIANMSLGGGASQAVDDAVLAAIEDGVTFVVAAGNEGAPVEYFSPARVEKAITVGATGVDDARAYYSNFGPLVDIFAPGSNITSAWKDSDTSYKVISGTSMAAPHVAGLLAYYIGLGIEDPAAHLFSSATPDIVTDTLNSSNLLAYNNAGDAAPPSATKEPEPEPVLSLPPTESLKERLEKKFKLWWPFVATSA